MRAVIPTVLLVACIGTSPAPDTTAPSGSEPGAPDSTPFGDPDAEGVPPGGGHLQVNAGQAVPVQVLFTTVGPLHQGFFRRRSSVQDLGEGLGVCTDHTVEVQVVWSQKDLEGRILGQLPAGTTVCTPTPADGGFDLSPVVPATRALAAYRDDVAGRSDFRIANFAVGVDLRARGATCRLRAAGQHPPDGTRFDPCVSINGERVCARGDRDKGVLRLSFDDPGDSRRFGACLKGG